MDTELLKTFMEVSRTRHFGRAAENLYLTQSAVSFRVRQLEGLLGVELFSRQRNNIQLTTAGEKLMPLAESTVRLEQKIRQEVAAEEGQSQQMAVGATPNLWDGFLQQQMAGLLDRVDGLSLTAVAHSSGNLIRQILERTLDLAFLFDAPKVDELTTLEVAHLPLYLCSSVSDVTISEALDHRYVLVDWGTAFQAQHNRQLKLTSTPALQTNTGRIALDCILSRGGAAYLPWGLIAGALDQQKLFLVQDAPVIPRTVYASFHSNGGSEHLIDTVIRQIAAAETNTHPLVHHLDDGIGTES
ncbi:LysR family transcriptional regulator [Candidatus Thalassolituus haligoni]|jgi:DNA-binding transcriptional LysR family regulator|uniref:LysR family transcriptional regulator n=1 Tax=Candidatus Thalassolituus haligoni TaxID=3100113 RepID=UPI003515CD02